MLSYFIISIRSKAAFRAPWKEQAYLGSEITLDMVVVVMVLSFRLLALAHDKLVFFFQLLVFCLSK